MHKRAGASRRYAHARVRRSHGSAPSYYYLVNDTRAFGTGKKGTLVWERAAIGNSPNRGGYHEDGSLLVGHFVGLDLFARRERVARLDSSCGAVCRRICLARGNTYGSWVGDDVDPIWAVPAIASDARAHAARVTLERQVGRGRQFLGACQEEGALLCERDCLLEIQCDGCGGFATERHLPNACC
jgi:hypothetical protein